MNSILKYDDWLVYLKKIGKPAIEITIKPSKNCLQKKRKMLRSQCSISQLLVDTLVFSHYDSEIKGTSNPA